MRNPPIIIFALRGLARARNTITGLKYISSPPTRCAIDSCKIIIPNQLYTYAVLKELADGTYECNERELVKKHVKPDDLVLELGGGIGVVSCVINKLLNDQSAHLVIEANPELIEPLKENRKINGCGFKILNLIPIGKSDGAFYIHKNAWAGSSVCRSGNKIKVPVKPWSLIERGEEFKPTALVMDIEGAEADFIAENESLLSSLRIAIIEFHPFKMRFRKIRECRSILSGCGLKRRDRIGYAEVWM